MKFLVLFFGLLSFLTIGCHSYVAVQKNNNKSQPLASSDRGSLKDRQSRRHYKRFEVRKRAEDQDLTPPQDKQLESLILTVDTGVRPAPTFGDSSNGRNPLDMIQKAIREATKLPNNPIYRAQEEYNIRPKLVHFRAQQNPSLKVDIDSKSIVRALNDLLASSAVRRYTDAAAKHAAVIYSALRDEFSKMAREERPAF